MDIAPKKDFQAETLEDDEREFWSTHDTTDYIDWDDSAVAVLPTLKQRLDEEVKP